MASPEFGKVVSQVGGVGAGAQKQLAELMEKYLVTMNLPSRAQMAGMAERLQGIESQLSEIKAVLYRMNRDNGPAEGGQPSPSRPPRTRQPPSADRERK
jgi:hypothetical protein